MAKAQAAEKQATAVLARDRKQLDYAENEVRRMEPVNRQGIISAQQWDQTRTAALAANATIAADEAAIAQAQAEAKADEAAIAQARLSLSWCTITAPIAGITGAVGLTSGNLATAGQSVLVTIARMQPMYVGFSLPARELPTLRAAQRQGPLTVTVLPEGGTTPSTGTLDLIDNQIAQDTATLRLRAVCANTGGELWPGQQCRVELTLGVEYPGGHGAGEGGADRTEGLPHLGGGRQPDRGTAPGHRQPHLEGAGGDRQRTGGGRDRGHRRQAAAGEGLPGHHRRPGHRRPGETAMNVPNLCIHRPVMTTLVMAGILGFGVLAWRQLPVSDLPRIDFPTIMVTTSLPGADPETMAAAVATPLERQFSTIAGIDSMTSVSQRGTCQVTIQFALERDIDAAAQDVQAAIAAAQRLLPPTLPTPPIWQKVNPAEMPILMLALRSEILPLSQVNECADTLIGPRISMLSGVAQVMVYGAQKFAVRVQADPEKLANRGLSLVEVAQALARGNSNLPTGTVWGTDKAWAVQTDAGLQNAEAFRPLVVAWRNGAPVRLEEVAQVIDGVQNDKVAAWYNDTRAVVLAVQRQPGTNTVEIVNAIRALLPRLQAQIPTQVQLDMIIDRSLPIRASIADVEHTLLLTAVLVVLVIFAFLRRASATIIPALSLPLSLIGTFSVMWLLNFNLDNLSLMALTLATGFVVDDAIVVLENVVRRMEEGEDVRTAALEGSSQIAFTVVAMTLSLAAVFIPVLFMGGILGRLFREFAVTVMVAIGVSGIVSLTLVPMLCSRFLRPAPTRHGRLYALSEAFFVGWRGLYERSLDVALLHPWLMLASLVATMALSAYLLVAVPKGMIPSEDLSMLSIATEYASDISFPEMVRHQRAVAEVVRANPNIDVFMSNVGNGTGNQGSLMVHLKGAPERHVSPEAVIGQLRKALAGQIGVRISPQNPPPIRIGGRMSRTQYQYTLQSTDNNDLYRAADAVLTRIRGLDELTDVSSDMQLDSPRLAVHLDRDRAASLGISADPDRDHPRLGLRGPAGLHHLHRHQPVLGDPGGGYSPPDRCSRHVRALPPSRPRLERRPRPPRSGGHDQHRDRPALHQPPGPVPRRDHLLQPAGRHLPGHGGGAHQRDGAPAPALDGHRRLLGCGPGLPILPDQHGRAAHPRHRGHLPRPRRPLRELHPSPDHPQRSALGRHRRPARPDGLPRRTERLQLRRSDHAGGHREEERDHDDRLRRAGADQGGPRRLPGHPSRLPGALPTHHDDHHGRLHGHPAPGHRLGNGLPFPAVPRHRGGGRPAILPVDHPLCHAGGLSAARPPAGESGRPVQARRQRVAGTGRRGDLRATFSHRLSGSR